MTPICRAVHMVFEDGVNHPAAVTHISAMLMRQPPLHRPPSPLAVRASCLATVFVLPRRLPCSRRLSKQKPSLRISEYGDPRSSARKIIEKQVRRPLPTPFIFIESRKEQPQTWRCPVFLLPTFFLSHHNTLQEFLFAYLRNICHAHLYTRH